MKIKDLYKPYNFSKSNCYVISYDVNGEPILKIEEKLPLQIEKLTGIYITCNSLSRENVIGYITVMFNEGILKTVQLPILNSNNITHHSHPIPLNETIKSNSIMQGYLFFRKKTKRQFTVKIYLHYDRS
jgi:hypothetical protein